MSLKDGGVPYERRADLDEMGGLTFVLAIDDFDGDLPIKAIREEEGRSVGACAEIKDDKVGTHLSGSSGGGV